jgi:hypothetical protein
MHFPCHFSRLFHSFHHLYFLLTNHSISCQVSCLHWKCHFTCLKTFAARMFVASSSQKQIYKNFKKCMDALKLVDLCHMR